MAADFLQSALSILPSSNPNSQWNGVHTALDLAGAIPGLGIAPDLINAGLYGLEGDWKNAAYSGAAAIPIAGDAALALKYAGKGAKALREMRGQQEGTEFLERNLGMNPILASGATALAQGGLGAFTHPFHWNTYVPAALGRAKEDMLYNTALHGIADMFSPGQVQTQVPKSGSYLNDQYYDPRYEAMYSSMSGPVQRRMQNQNSGLNQNESGEEDGQR
jgi:hypothetical protein